MLALILALVPVLAAALTGCGVPGSGVIDVGPPATGLPSVPAEPRTPTRLFVYLLTGDRPRLHPVARELRTGPNPVATAVEEVFAGPTRTERATLGTRLPRLAGAPQVHLAAGRTVFVRLPDRTPPLDDLAMRQLTCTAAVTLRSSTAAPSAAHARGVTAALPPVRVEVDVRVHGSVHRRTLTDEAADCPAPPRR